MGKTIADTIREGLSISGAKDVAKNAYAGSRVGLRSARNKNIKNYVSTKIDKESASWDAMEKTPNKIISAKIKLDKNTKKRLKSKGLY